MFDDIFESKNLNILFITSNILSFSLFLIGVLGLRLEIVLSSLIYIISSKQFIKTLKDLTYFSNNREDTEHNLKWFVTYGILFIISVPTTAIFFISYNCKMFLSVLSLSFLASLFVYKKRRC